MIPYVGDYILLCYTWNKNISTISKFRLNVWSDKGLLSYLCHSFNFLFNLIISRRLCVHPQ